MFHNDYWNRSQSNIPNYHENVCRSAWMLIPGLFVLSSSFSETWVIDGGPHRFRVGRATNSFANRCRSFTSSSQFRLTHLQLLISVCNKLILFRNQCSRALWFISHRFGKKKGESKSRNKLDSCFHSIASHGKLLRTMIEQKAFEFSSAFNWPLITNFWLRILKRVDHRSSHLFHITTAKWSIETDGGSLKRNNKSAALSTSPVNGKSKHLVSKQFVLCYRFLTQHVVLLSPRLLSS